MSNMIKGSWGIGLVLGIVAFAIFGDLKTRKRRNERMALMGNGPPDAVAILDAMCHAAKADGAIDDKEVTEISQAARQLTGEDFSADTVRRMIELAADDPSESDCKLFLEALASDQAQVMMRAVLTVVASDGQLSGKEPEFVGKLMRAMKMTGEDVSDMMQEVTAGQQPA